MTLVDLKRTKADKQAEEKRWELSSGGDDYPWGLQIHLDNETIEKMKLGDFDADDTVQLTAEGFIAEDSTNKRDGKTVRSMRVQITKLSLVPASVDAAKVMYEDG